MHLCVHVQKHGKRPLRLLFLQQCVSSQREHTLHCTHDFLQARPSVYFSCKERSSSVYNSHPKPSLWYILPATSARRAKAALASPNPPPVFAQFAEYPPTFFMWRHFFQKTKGVVNWFEVHVNSSAFMSQIPLRDGFYPLQLRGGCEERGLFSSHAKKVENSLYPSTLCRPPYLQGIESGVKLKDRMGYLGRGQGLFSILNV